MHRRALLSALLLGGCSTQPYGLGAVLRGQSLAESEPSFDVPYVPTPDAVVAAMLALGEVDAGRRTIDLGSGDGRLAIAAAMLGADATGVELDGALVGRARYRAAQAGVAERVRFVQQDLFDTGLRGFDVVTLYLLPRINLQLRPRLLAELAPGARVVSHAFDMGDWTPDEHRLVEEKHVYLWIVPAVAGGSWRMTMADGSTRSLVIAQRYQKVSGTLDGVAIEGARLHGAALDFTCADTRYRGIVGDAAIAADPAAADAVRGWTARRI